MYTIKIRNGEKSATFTTDKINAENGKLSIDSEIGLKVFDKHDFDVVIVTGATRDVSATSVKVVLCAGYDVKYDNVEFYQNDDFVYFSSPRDGITNIYPEHAIQDVEILRAPDCPSVQFKLVA